MEKDSLSKKCKEEVEYEIDPIEVTRESVLENTHIKLVKKGGRVYEKRYVIEAKWLFDWGIKKRGWFVWKKYRKEKDREKALRALLKKEKTLIEFRRGE